MEVNLADFDRRQKRDSCSQNLFTWLRKEKDVNWRKFTWWWLPLMSWKWALLASPGAFMEMWAAGTVLFSGLKCCGSREKHSVKGDKMEVPKKWNSGKANNSVWMFCGMQLRHLQFSAWLFKYCHHSFNRFSPGLGSDEASISAVWFTAGWNQLLWFLLHDELNPSLTC